MNLKTIIFFLILALIIGGLAALVFMDVPVAQKDVSKEISYDRPAPAQ